MTDRDNLTALIYPLLPDSMLRVEAEKLADAILAAGWRPPTAPLYNPQADDGCPQCVAIRSSATA